MPNVVLEAMSSKLPIVIRRIPGVNDFMFKYDNGFVYEKTEEAINYLLNDFKNPIEREKTAENARKTALQKFDYPIIINQYLDVYKQLSNNGFRKLNNSHKITA